MYAVTIMSAYTEDVGEKALQSGVEFRVIGSCFYLRILFQGRPNLNFKIKSFSWGL